MCRWKIIDRNSKLGNNKNDKKNNKSESNNNKESKE